MMYDEYDTMHIQLTVDHTGPGTWYWLLYAYVSESCGGAPGSTHIEKVPVSVPGTCTVASYGGEIDDILQNVSTDTLTVAKMDDRRQSPRPVQLPDVTRCQSP